MGRRSVFVSNEAVRVCVKRVSQHVNSHYVVVFQKSFIHAIALVFREATEREIEMNQVFVGGEKRTQSFCSHCLC